ncbi:MAG: hypothetical protein HQ581_23770, partial [Planctomycetes bacterium]|nr:hypothetical protein [Planctomycetota bacterium]
GTLVIRYQGKVIAQQTISPAHRGPVVLDGLEAHLRPGINRLTLELTGTGTLPYVLEIGRRTD